MSAKSRPRGSSAAESSTNVDALNDNVAQFLHKLGKVYDTLGDVPRSRTFIDAAALVQDSVVPITSGAVALSVFKGKGIGPATAKEIDQFISTGTSDRMIQLTTGKEARKLEQLRYFRSFYGIGPEKALELYNAGFTSIDDVWEQVELTDAQKVGIIWHEHIEQPIERTEVDFILEHMHELLDHEGINFFAAGSYRRGEEFLGDIDIVVEDDGHHTLSGVILLLSSILVAKLALDDVKFMGIVRISDKYYGHRIDIYFKKPDVLPYTLLALTGSGRFVRLMRKFASKKGLRLNEYGLFEYKYPKRGSFLAKDEAAIFERLGLVYVSPEDRRADVGQLETL